MSLVLNGSGTITGLNAGGLPSASVTQASLAANVAGNGPAFSASPSGTQSFSTGVFVTVALGSEQFDTDNNFDSTTNYRHTPTRAGYYRYEWGVDGRGTTLTVGHSQLYKNGAVIKSGSWAASSSSVSLSGGSAIVYMNGSTDYVELYGYTSAASGNLFNAGSAATYLSGSYIGP